MSAFSYRRRVLGCDACGTPVEVAPGGGPARCSRCGASLVAPLRPDTAVPRSAPMHDGERLNRLRQQDGRPLLPPPGLEAVMPGGSIEPWKLNEARAVWAQTRRHLTQSPSDVAAAERLVFLTMALSNVIGQTGDDGGLRAIYEGALEVLTLPRHRQTMRGYLARHAARTGDVESAEAWLAGCDPGSDDLFTDSVYRITRAYIETGANRPQGVLQILGGSEQDVPINDAMDALATVLRANAWERMGNLDAARHLLSRFMSSQSGISAAVESVVKAMPAQWQVCAQSIHGARQDHRAHVGDRAGSGALFGWIFIGAGFLPLLFVIPSAIAVVVGGGSLLEVLPMGFVLLFPAILGGIGYKMVQAADRAKAIAREGQHGRGRVLAVTPTGTTINDVPMMRIDVEVQVPGVPPVRASSKKLLHHAQASMLVGRELGVIWQPKYPDEVVLDL
jgi:hypothetical protein